jgi:hypothetical protein
VEASIFSCPSLIYLNMSFSLGRVRSLADTFSED